MRAGQVLPQACGQALFASTLAFGREFGRRFLAGTGGGATLYARPERWRWRKASIGSSLPLWSTCQKLQPLHDGAPISAAPTWWIEPLWPPDSTEPSSRTLAFQRRLAS